MLPKPYELKLTGGVIGNRWNDYALNELWLACGTRLATMVRKERIEENSKENIQITPKGTEMHYIFGTQMNWQHVCMGSIKYV